MFNRKKDRCVRFGRIGIAAATAAMLAAMFWTPAHAGSIGDNVFGPSISGLETDAQR